MNIKDATKHIKNTITAYLEKDEKGDFVIPVNKQRPVFLYGPPGIGKTAVMEQIAKELKIGIVSYSMTHHTRQSALGLPFIKTKTFGGIEYDVSEFTMSEILSDVYSYIEKTDYKNGILFLDEINCVSETLAPSMLRFLQYKTFGSHPVPDGWVIVAAGNPPEYNKSVKEYDIATLDRIQKIDVTADYGVWRDYAINEKIHPSIITYLDSKPTDFYIVDNAGKQSFFVTPTNNFQYYLKSKGSLFRCSSSVIGTKVGYALPKDLVLDYFGGFGEIVDFEDISYTFVYLNKLTQFVMKLIEKMYFIPTVKRRGQMFRIVYEPIIANNQLARIINQFEENIPEDLFIQGERPKNFVSEFIYEYLNYVVYKFLGIKAYKFKDVKSGTYLIKDLEQKSLMKGNDYAENFAQWFDELYLGKYDVIPFFKVNKLSDEEFELKVHIKNRKTDEEALIDDLYVKDEVFGVNSADIAKIVEKQLNYATRYMPELETLFEDEDKLSLTLDLGEVYKIITQTAYYLQKAQLEVILPDELVNVVVPRASINAKVKASRSGELLDIFNTTSSTSISLTFKCLLILLFRI